MKRILSFMLVLCLCLVMLFTVSIQAETVKATDDSLVEINQTTDNCHTLTDQWFGKALAKRAVNNAGISTECNNLLKDYFSLREERFYNSVPTKAVVKSSALSETVKNEHATYASAILDLQKRANMNITDAESTMFCDQDHIEVYDDRIVLYVYEWVFFDYDDLSDTAVATDVSGYGVTHRLTLKADANGEYYILYDEYDQSDMLNICTINETTYNDLQTMNYQPVDSDVSMIEMLTEESNGLATRSKHFTGYNPDAAVEYADKYVYHGATGTSVYSSYYNSAYYNFNSLGGDCANYTSQCIYAGGMPQVKGTAYGTNGWYYNSSTDRSATWTGTSSMCNWMANNRGTLAVASDSTIYKGSPVFYNNQHTVICVGRNSAGTPIINSHNKDAYHVKWTYFSNLSNTQTVQLTSSDPGNDHSTHTFTGSYMEGLHPHKEYKMCYCGATQYTGATCVKSTCPDCMLPKFGSVLPCKAHLCVTSTVYPYSTPQLYAQTGGEIWVKDECTITAIYTNGACEVKYPTDSGEKTAYVHLSCFIKNPTASLKSVTVNQQVTTYVRANDSVEYGYVDAGTTIFTLGINGNRTQVFYAIDEQYGGGYKLAWVETTALPAVTYEATTNKGLNATFEISEEVKISANVVEGDYSKCYYILYYTSDDGVRTLIEEDTIQTNSFTKAFTQSGKYECAFGVHSVYGYIESSAVTWYVTDDCGSEHSYDDGVVTKMPTCTTAGVRTYTCSKCSNSYIESIAATGHSYSAATCTTPATCTFCGATTGNLATHSYDGNMDATCNVCGEVRLVTDPNLKFAADPGLSFQEYIGLQVMFQDANAQNYDKCYVEIRQVTPDGVVKAMSTGTAINSKYRYFEQQIVSWSMTDEVTMTLYAEKDGVLYQGASFTTTVKDLAMEKLATYYEAVDLKTCKALVDMLNYGAAVQTAYDHNASSLPNADLGKYAALGTTDTPSMSTANNITGTNKLKVYSANISLQDKVEFQFMVKTSDLSGKTVKATLNGANVDVAYTEYGSYTIIRVAAAAAHMRSTYTIVVNDANGNPVTCTYNVSVEAYAKDKLSDEKADAFIAMMRYGDAVAAIG